MEEGVNNIAEHVHNSRQSSGWNPCKPHAEDAPRLSKYHAKVFGMTRHYAKPSKYHAQNQGPQNHKMPRHSPRLSMCYAITRQSSISDSESEFGLDVNIWLSRPPLAVNRRFPANDSINNHVNENSRSFDVMKEKTRLITARCGPWREITILHFIANRQFWQTTCCVAGCTWIPQSASCHSVTRLYFTRQKIWYGIVLFILYWFQIWQFVRFLINNTIMCIEYRPIYAGLIWKYK